MPSRHQPFDESDEDSDVSSVKSDTTSEPLSEPTEREWDVEKILAERVIDGTVKYLIKWESFPLGECSFEPLENLGGGADNDALKEWTKQKRRIRKGDAQPFDIQRFYDAKASFDQEQEQEQERRQAKRDKKRHQRAATPRIGREPATPRIGREPTTKKGVARKVSETSARPSLTTSDRKRKRAPPTRTSNVAAPLNSPASKAPGTKDRDSISAATVPLGTVSRPAGNATSPATIFNKWAETPKARGRQRVNEPQPNPNNLTFVDLKTGRPSETAGSSSGWPSGLRLNTDVPRPEVDQVDNSTIPHTSEPRSTQTSYPRPGYPRSLPYCDKKSMTCRFWLRNRRCKLDEKACKYAHRECDLVEPKRQQICKFWRDGSCQFADELCEFQHSQPPWEDGGFRIPGRRGETFYDRRSASPERGGVRQDEAERRGRTSRANTMTHAQTIVSPTISSSSVCAPSLPLTGSITTQSSNPRILRESDTLDKTSVAENAYQQAPDETLVPDLPACLKIVPSDSPTLELDIRLVFDKRASRTKLISIMSEKPSFEAQDMCLAQDFKKYWFQKGRTWTSGRVVPISKDDIVAEYLNDYLLMNNTGVMVRHKEFIMLIYPTNSPEWGFLPDRGLETLGLRFHVQLSTLGTMEPIISKPSTQSISSDGKSLFITRCEQHLDLSQEVIFAGNNGRKVEKCVYMLFPSQDLPETKLVKAYFEGIGAKVYHSSDTKLWTDLQEGKLPESVIVFHPAVYNYWEILNLHVILHNRSDNIFQLGPDRSLRSRLNAATCFSCVRLFPTGQLILITDDVFKYHPGLAFRVLDSFERKAGRAPQGGRNDRICARPGLLAWLGQLIDEDYERGILTQDSDRIKVFQAAVKLSALEGNETNVALHAFKLATSVLYSPPRNEAPQYERLWDSSEEDATDWLVEWFCGYCVMEREHFRRFTVLYEQHRKPVQTPGLNEFKDPKDWMVKAQHVKVTNPIRFLEHHKAKEQAKTRV